MSGSQIKESNKRKVENVPLCKYGSECYRKNPTHFLEYSHPEMKKLKAENEVKKENKECVVPFFLSTVQGIDHEFNKYAISIKDILSENFDELKESVQFNYMFDVEWLIKMYPVSSREKPLLLVHGHTGSNKTDLEASALKYSNIDLVQARLPIAYGTHHSKMMFLFYSTGLRIIITTANLVEQDWFQKTQGIWKSPLFAIKDVAYDGKNDPFKEDLLEYLSSYGNSKLGMYAEKLKEYDMSSANVHLVSSVPGRYTGFKMHQWGHLKLRKLLLSYGPSKDLVNENWPIIGQFSSIGSLGSESSSWLCGEWLSSLSTCKDDELKESKANLKLIYPTIENVRNSLEGYSAGCSLPYGIQVAMKQRYLKDFLNSWASDSVGRSLAAPHIKTYTRVSPDCKSAAWFLLTSANLSKAAWGSYEKDKKQFMIRSYEIGVLFLPKKTNCATYTIISGEESEVCLEKEFLRFPYDLPLLPYSSSDKPWVWDICYTKEDSHGRLWMPS
ncbi:tyrosyl-DNA phosphodiesterase 1 isoform X1 [Hydra vulgaris]|nr:tyrosyl-DNA phosphodiesterase 1 [Hydra vulgaris]